jgi:branched-chain amino acid aminotransferase
MAGVLPVVEVDGRKIGSGARGPVVARLQAVYASLMDREASGGREVTLQQDGEGGEC